MKNLDIERPIVIVGAGISGLTLSILLSQQGKKSLILERRPTYTKNDAEDVRSFNLTITERGMKSFRAIGLDEQVIRNSVPLKSRIVHSHSSCICNPEMMEQKYGNNPDDVIYSIPRTTLINLLYEHAKNSTHTEILFDSDVVEVNKTNSTVVVGSSEGNKRTIQYQLLIGADGAYSKVRSYLLLGEIVDFRINYFSWFYKKFVIPAEDRHVLQMKANSLHVFPKQGGLVVAIPNQDKSFSCIYCTQVSDPADLKSERAQKEIEAKFQTHFPYIYGLSDHVRKTFNRSKISGLVSVNISQWTSEGNIVLVGDAAHAVFPFYGQGMNSALQDCRKLILALEEEETIEKALSKYEKSQKQSTDALSHLCTKHFYYLQAGCTSSLLESQKIVNNVLAKVYPKLWQSEYRMVAQTELPYDEIFNILKKQSFYRKLLGLFLFDYIIAVIRFMIKKFKKALLPRRFVKKQLMNEQAIV